ncbi:MAG: hypothetical protein ACFFG0_00165 [Candidatus Thorarchaeota archaeon]
MAIDKCNPCWAYNVLDYTESPCCLAYDFKAENLKDCPCRVCLIRSTCVNRCEERSKFVKKVIISFDKLAKN